MKQVLVDLYKVEFNQVKTLPGTNVCIVTHETNPEDYIVLGSVNRPVFIGEPFLLPLSKYGGGFKNKTLIEKGSCWVGSTIAGKLAGGNTAANRGKSYRMVEE